LNKIFIAAITGIILGFVFAKLLFLQYLTLVPWGIAGFVIGYFCKKRNEALISGFIYGFFLGLVFMLAIYSGRDPVITKLPFFVILGIVSAILGVITGALGFFSKKVLK